MKRYTLNAIMFLLAFFAGIVSIYVDWEFVFNDPDSERLERMDGNHCYH